MKKTQKDFIRDLSASNKEVTQKSASDVIDAITHVLKSYLDEGHEVVIPGLGKFYVGNYKERNHFNPATKQVETIQSSKKLKFKAARNFGE